MKILAIECTHGFASVAVSNGEQLFERRLEDWQKTAESLVPLVMQVMEEADLQPAGLDGVAVSSGPGSFTALRIGMSVAKGIAFGAGLPLVPVPTMQVMAREAMERHGAANMVTVIPSRVGEYFYSIYRREDAALAEIESSRCQSSQLADRLFSAAGSFIITGRSIDELAAEEPRLAPNCIEATFFSASSLLHYAGKALSAGIGEAASGAVPDYRQVFVPAQRS